LQSLALGFIRARKHIGDEIERRIDFFALELTGIKFCSESDNQNLVENLQIQKHALQSTRNAEVHVP
jgi:hypothetical protein